ncbi:hypothetical protein CTAYLR_005244 [Chrysophaeum taylorii]|uniref:Protein kinase domain-containing protein n=1 Tax=Chrysophaeum taylorii TaxID=2483200 RepID=A0AAD7XHE7_9STRA|nr:hypothetical protein CTAYLR_005244 [Chrysophaeum taylorii]
MSSEVIGGTYTLGGVIGRGGQAVVHQAWQRKTGAFVAIKKLKVKGPDGGSLESIATEIELLSKLDHPNIVKYFDVVDDDGHLHIVLEYMENGSLASVRKHFGNFSEPVCAMYMRQVLAGLDYLHAQGVLHRDIKGANILTTKDGVAKLADFGLAARAATFGDASVQDEVIGSPYWMAPEIIEMSAAPSAACDIWSLGCTIIELTAGKPPHFDLAPMAALFRIVQDDVPPLPGGISEALRDFLLQCFNRESVLRAGARALLGHAWLARARTSSSANAGDAGNPPPPRLAAVEEDEPLGGASKTASWSTARDKSESIPIVSLRSLTSDTAYDDEAAAKMPAELRLSDSDLDAFLDDHRRASGGQHLGSLLSAFLEVTAADDDDEENWAAAAMAGASADVEPRLPSLSVVCDEQNLLDKLSAQVDEGLLSPTPFLTTTTITSTTTTTTASADEPPALARAGSAEARTTRRRDTLARFRENDDDESFDFGLDLEKSVDELELSERLAKQVARPSISVATKASSSSSSASPSLRSDGEYSECSDFPDDDSSSSNGRGSSLVDEDPFASCLFDDERDFLHDDARERETRRLDEIETLLERLPLAFADGATTEVVLNQKTEAACAALRRLVDRKNETEPICLREHAVSSLLEAVERSLERRCVATTVAVLRVVHAVCRRGDLEAVVALGLTPLLARVVKDLLPNDAGCSSALVHVASVVERVCSHGSDDAVRLFIGGDGLGVLCHLLLPAGGGDAGLPEDHAVAADDGVEGVEAGSVVDVHRWSAAKVAVDALLCVLRREGRAEPKPLLRSGSSDQKLRERAVGRANSRAARPSRNSICLALARLDAPPRLASGLAAAIQLEDAARRAISKTNDEPARRRIAGASALAERSAAALCAFCEADAHVRDRVARSRTVKVILAVLAAAPKRVALMTAQEEHDDDDDDDDVFSEADAHTRLAVALVKALKALCMASAEALEALASAGAIEVVVGLLAAAQRGDGETLSDDDDDDDEDDDPAAAAATAAEKNFPHRDELEDQLVPCLYYLCRIDRARLARAAACGAARRLAACVARRRHLKQFALAILCELCHAASADCVVSADPDDDHPDDEHPDDDSGKPGDNTIASELWRAGGVKLYSRLLAEAYWGVRALAALAAWLARDATRRVQAELATPTCAERVVALLRASQRAEFEHALPPLRDALERSSPFAASLLAVGSRRRGGGPDDAPPGQPKKRKRRRHAFAREIGRRLRRHTSAIVRKALLEILRAALKAAPHPRGLLSQADLVLTLERLAVRDADQVLVRDLALSILAARYADDPPPPPPPPPPRLSAAKVSPSARRDPTPTTSL